MPDRADDCPPARDGVVVSVIMPVRNGAAYALGAARCVLDQSYERLELIVIDDHSEDDTVGALSALDDPRLRIVSSPDRGLVAALRHGTSIAHGDLVARMDVDDVCDVDRIERQVEFMASHPAAVVVGSSFEVVDVDGRHVRFEPALGSDADLRRELYVRNPLGHGTTMMRRSVLDAVGGYRSTFPHAEDYDLWVRLATAGELGALPEPLYRWRRHDESASATHHRAQVASTAQIQAGLWLEPPVSLGVDELRRRLGGYRRERACDGALADRFLQVQLAVARGAARRGHVRLALAQVAAVVRTEPASILAVFWFVVSGGRHVSRRSVAARLFGRST
jgi:glycosyltransferase involved in cell wall biosynthesis